MKHEFTAILPGFHPDQDGVPHLWAVTEWRDGPTLSEDEKGKSWPTGTVFAYCHVDSGYTGPQYHIAQANPRVRDWSAINGLGCPASHEEAVKKAYALAHLEATAEAAKPAKFVTLFRKKADGTESFTSIPAEKGWFAEQGEQDGVCFEHAGGGIAAQYYWEDNFRFAGPTTHNTLWQGVKWLRERWAEGKAKKGVAVVPEEKSTVAAELVGVPPTKKPKAPNTFYWLDERGEIHAEGKGVYNSNGSSYWRWEDGGDRPIEGKTHPWPEGAVLVTFLCGRPEDRFWVVKAVGEGKRADIYQHLDSRQEAWILFLKEQKRIKAACKATRRAEKSVPREEDSYSFSGDADFHRILQENPGKKFIICRVEHEKYRHDRQDKTGPAEAWVVLTRRTGGDDTDYPVYQYYDTKEEASAGARKEKWTVFPELAG